ncbi:MAG TPA: RICIN domain-containing protein, partial [Mycobacteriales bacterium]
APSVTYTSWSSGLCLGVASPVPAAGSTLRVATCGSPTARAFRTPAVGAGLALVDPVTGLCVEVAGASSADGAQVVLATCANRTYQQFRTSATAYSDGMVRLVAVHSGKCLDIADQAYARPGSVVHQWTCHTAWEERGLRNQSWHQS